MSLSGHITGLLSLCLEDVIWLLRINRHCAARAKWLRGLPRSKSRIRRIEITNVQIHFIHQLARKLADFASWLEGGR